MSQTDLTDWLLDACTPSIRYLTLRRLLGHAESDPEVQTARQQMAAIGPIPKILAGQTESGHWAGEHSYYTPKYTSTHWSMMLLAELDADRNDPRMGRGADFMLADTESGATKALEKGRCSYSCFWGNLLRYAIHAGRASDPRVRPIVRQLIFDAREVDWRCPINDEQPCAWGAARALWGLAALPAEHHTPEVEEAIRRGLTFLLERYSLVKADYPTPGKVHSMWSRLNFPLFYQADILFVLRVVGNLGALDHPGAQPALEWLKARQQANGRWRGASPYRRRTWEEAAAREDTDRWVSLHAALILREASA